MLQFNEKERTKKKKKRNNYRIGKPAKPSQPSRLKKSKWGGLRLQAVFITKG